MTLEEAILQGKRAWDERGEDVMITLGKSVLTFHEGRLEMLQDDTGKTFAIPKGTIFVKKD